VVVADVVTSSIDVEINSVDVSAAASVVETVVDSGACVVELVVLDTGGLPADTKIC
jgi:hypothetical protein